MEQPLQKSRKTTGILTLLTSIWLHYPNNEQTSPYHLLATPSARLGSNKVNRFNLPYFSFH